MPARKTAQAANADAGNGDEGNAARAARRKARHMRYAKIDPLSIANGPGCRVALFVTGCRNGCRNCFNAREQDFEYGEEFDDDAMARVLDLLARPHVSGITILGGEPLEPENQPGVLRLVRAVRERYGSSRTIWLFTGFTMEALRDESSRAHVPTLPGILDDVDVVVDGPFVQSLASPVLRFRGSSNQRIVNLAAMRERRTDEIVEWDDGMRRGHVSMN